MKKTSDLLKVSCSSLKTYEQCPRKWYFSYILKLPKKSFEHLVLGNFCHAVLEQFHEELRLSPNLDMGPLLTYCFQNQLQLKTSEGELQFPLTKASKLRAHEMLQSYLKMLRRDGLPIVLANEQEFNIKLEENLEIRGFIDRIDTNQSGFNIIDYKGLSIDTPIPTPTGWTTMGELKIGDKVLGSDGKPTNVIVKSNIHNRPCYKLTLSDKSTIVCDNVHLWNIGFRKVGRNKNYDTTIDADELFSRFEEQKKLGGSGSFVIENHYPLQLPEVQLPINPWLLGAWLGDGTSKTGSLTVGSQDLEEIVSLLKKHWGRISITQEAGREVFTITCLKPHPDLCGYGHYWPSEASHCHDCSTMNNRFRLSKGQITKPERANIPFRTQLAKNNLLRNKHIPAIYLRASFEQRLELLRGLMDTDGSWNPLRKRCVFVSSQKDFAESVVELIRTFGITVQTFTATDKLGFISYRIEFRPVGINPFSLPRKARAVEKTFPLGCDRASSIFAKRRTIVKMEKVESVPTQCIAVDAADSLYLCGSGLVPTHNTGKSKYLDEFQLLVYGLYLINQHPELQNYRASYIVLGEGCKNINYIFSRTDVDRCITKIKKVATQIRTDQTWEPKPGFLCKYCDFEDVCPATNPSSKYDLVQVGAEDWTQVAQVQEPK